MSIHRRQKRHKLMTTTTMATMQCRREWQRSADSHYSLHFRALVLVAIGEFNNDSNYNRSSSVNNQSAWLALNFCCDIFRVSDTLQPLSLPHQSLTFLRLCAAVSFYALLCFLCVHACVFSVYTYVRHASVGNSTIVAVWQLAPLAWFTVVCRLS